MGSQIFHPFFEAIFVKKKKKQNKKNKTCPFPHQMVLLVPCQKSFHYICESLFQSSLLCSIDLYVCLYASAMLFLINVSTFNIIIIFLWACVLNCFSCVQLFATPWTVACQAPLSMGFSRQKYWRGLPYPSPGDLPNPGIEPASLKYPALAEGSLPLAPPGKP